jgi:ferredoxin/flavodoxin---NADP+ reductase
MKLMRDAVDAGQVELLTHREVREIHGDACVTAVTIFDNRTGEDTTYEVDAVLSLIGFKPDLGPIASWGLELARNTIKVNHLLETNLPRVYAAGDIAHYEGKLELIATGFSEAAMAVNHAVHEINPESAVQPRPLHQPEGLQGARGSRRRRHRRVAWQRPPHAAERA